MTKSATSTRPTLTPVADPAPAPAAPATPEQTSLAVVAQAEIAPFRPENLNQAARLATSLARSNMLPIALRGKPADVLVVLITGHELGLSPMQSIRGMHVIEGKAVMAAEMMAGLVRSRPRTCRYLMLVESTDALATYETHREGDPRAVQLSYTIEQATKAGLVARDNWKKHPAAMLRARCLTAICRAVYSDLVNGVYDPEELEALALEATGEARRLAPAVGASRLDALASTLRAPKVPASDLLDESGDLTTEDFVEGMQPATPADAGNAEPLQGNRTATTTSQPGAPNAQGSLANF